MNGNDTAGLRVIWYRLARRPMLPAMSDERAAGWRIGEFRFRPDTGELQSLTAAEARYARLGPQPAQLLDLLAANSGRMVSRDEIRERLWPDTHVDLDQSLSFCVRQIRSALGDSARDPTYVETLPRRGYRLLQPATRMGEATLQTPPAPAPARAQSGQRIALIVAGAATLTLTLALLGWLASGDGTANRPTRLAIMPFELAAADDAAGRELAVVSESLVVDLARERDLEIVGPRFTAIFTGSPFRDLLRMAEELDVDYVINARLLSEANGPRLIVEMIRLRDGAHSWVESFSPFSSSQSVAASVRSGVAAVLAADPR